MIVCFKDENVNVLNFLYILLYCIGVKNILYWCKLYYIYIYIFVCNVIYIKIFIFYIYMSVYYDFKLILKLYFILLV